jgi:hypothetical protein
VNTPNNLGSPAAGSSVRSWMAPDERLLWEGKPDVGAYSMRGAWYLIPFSILWAGFALFWEFNVLTGGAPFFFGLWGIPFVLFGLYLVFGRIWVARREARKTTYAITNRRVLIVSGAFRPSFTALELRALPGAQIDEDRDGRGSITFGTITGFQLPPGWPSMGARYAKLPAFLAIADVRKVFDIYDRARAEPEART